MRVNQLKNIKQFDFGSDLHNDFFYNSPDWENIKHPDSNILVLAGDISNNVDIDNQTILKAKEHYEYVLTVDGNHTHYNTMRGVRRLNSVSDNLNKLFHLSIVNDWYFLPARDFIVGDTVFIGENGWYNFAHPDYSSTDQIKTWQTYMSDSRLILFPQNEDEHYYNYEVVRKLAEMAKRNLSAKITEYDKNPNINTIVIVTHTLPQRQALIIKPGKSENNKIWNLLSGSFLNSHMETIHLHSTKVKFWCFGHTHSEHNFKVDHTNFLCNPRGYPTEKTSSNWKPKTVKF